MPLLNLVILVMLMTQDITLMDETLMEVASLWRLPEGHHVAPVTLGIMVVEVHHLVLVAVLTVVSMVIGLETAQQEIGRTNVTAVVKEDTLRETARTVLVLRRPGVVEATPGHQLNPAPLAAEEAQAVAVVTVVVVATADHGPQ